MSVEVSNDLDVCDEIKQFVDKVINRNGLSSNSEIKYGPGADAGDGYTSKTYTVEAVDGEKSLHLFIKAPIVHVQYFPIEQLMKNETYFYGTLYPAYQSFLEEKHIEDGFRNVPKCYGIEGNLIALDNLKHSGFCLFPKGKCLNDDHIVLAMKTFAKFHAISYAFKDQKKEQYHTFTHNVQAQMGAMVVANGFDKFLSTIINTFLKGLHPVDDKDLLDASGNLAECLTEALVTAEKDPNEYATITQGDCWSNNIMYSYDVNDTNCPSDIMLVDWQLIRRGSPALDLSYFFYPIASESTIEKYEYYLEVYHKELSERIKQLGSDPDILYPFSILMEEWKKFTKFGFSISFFMIRNILVDKNEVPNLEEYPEIFDKLINSGADPKTILPEMRNELLYQSRLKLIFRHFLKHNFLQ